MTELSAPRIVLGMHRSGTTLMARLLGDFGVFLGADLSVNAESLFFRRLNERIFRSAGASWAEVAPLLAAMKRPEFIAEEAGQLRRELFERDRLGRFFAAGRERHDPGKPWGFKDPRNSLTLPIWDAVFPDARTVSLLRHGYDVAISLHRRAHAHRAWWKKLHPAYKVSTAMLEFGRCFELWADHQRALQRCGNALSDRFLEIRYESLIREPTESLRRVLEHLELEVTDVALERAAARIDVHRLDDRDRWRGYRDAIAALPDHSLLAELGYEVAP